MVTYQVKSKVKMQFFHIWESRDAALRPKTLIIIIKPKLAQSTPKGMAKVPHETIRLILSKGQGLLTKGHDN